MTDNFKISAKQRFSLAELAGIKYEITLMKNKLEEAAPANISPQLINLLRDLENYIK